MQISVESVKALRDLTGAGIMDSKNALVESNGDIAKAEQILRDKGVASAMKKSSRATNQGLVESYIHSGGRIGRSSRQIAKRILSLAPTISKHWPMTSLCKSRRWIPNIWMHQTFPRVRK